MSKSPAGSGTSLATLRVARVHVEVDAVGLVPIDDVDVCGSLLVDVDVAVGVEVLLHDRLWGRGVAAGGAHAGSGTTVIPPSVPTTTAIRQCMAGVRRHARTASVSGGGVERRERWSPMLGGLVPRQYSTEAAPIERTTLSIPTRLAHIAGGL